MVDEYPCLPEEFMVIDRMIRDYPDLFMYMTNEQFENFGFFVSLDTAKKMCDSFIYHGVMGHTEVCSGSMITYKGFKILVK